MDATNIAGWLGPLAVALGMEGSKPAVALGAAALTFAGVLGAGLSVVRTRQARAKPGVVLPRGLTPWARSRRRRVAPGTPKRTIPTVRRASPWWRWDADWLAR
jgi:hypothetical protein